MTWNTLEEYNRDRLSYPVVGFRGLQLGLFGKNTSRVSGNEIDRIANAHTTGTYIISEVPRIELQNPERLGVQGELSWFDGRWCLYYADRLGYMRDALKQHGKHVFGLAAKMLIERSASASGVHMLFEVFEKFSQPGDYPVIEFTVFPVPLGRYRQDTVIWEVRNGY